jgi:alpha-glucosidase
MDHYKVFTLGENFPLDKMRALVNDLHSKDQHYIVMVDPGSS